MEPIGLKVNGKAVSVTVDEQTPLLDILRNHLGLKGTKFGCGLEQCGCCMVLVDGRPEKSCGKSLAAVVGKEIVTISFPATAESGLPQDFSGLPSINTMQQPHCSRPQPNLVPIKPTWLRRTSSSGVCSSAVTVTAVPFTFRPIGSIDGSLQPFAGTA